LVYGDALKVQARRTRIHVGPVTVCGKGHRIIEWFELEGTLKVIQFQCPCNRWAHLPLDQVAQSPIQPGLEHCQGLGKMRVYPGHLRLRNYQLWPYSVLFNVTAGMLISKQKSYKKQYFGYMSFYA